MNEYQDLEAIRAPALFLGSIAFLMAVQIICSRIRIPRVNELRIRKPRMNGHHLDLWLTHDRRMVNLTLWLSGDAKRTLYDPLAQKLLFDAILALEVYVVVSGDEGHGFLLTSLYSYLDEEVMNRPLPTR
jgi:hypothetical protein